MAQSQNTNFRTTTQFLEAQPYEIKVNDHDARSFTIMARGGSHLGWFRLRTWAMNCCGMGEMNGVPQASTFINELGINTVIAAMLNAQAMENSYLPWNFVYAIPTTYETYKFHQEMVKLGAVKMGDGWANEAHGNHHINLWRINLKNCLHLVSSIDIPIVSGSEYTKKLYLPVVEIPNVGKTEVAVV